MKIAITGATGFVGSHLVEMLLEQNVAPTCLIRKTSNLRWLPTNKVHFVTGDLNHSESLRALVENADWIFHLAGLTKARNEEEYFRANYQGLVHLVQAIERFNPHVRRLIFVSSQAAAGPSYNGIPRTESDPPNPISAYGRSKLAAEEFLRHQAKLPFTIVRPPAVYGPRDRDVFAAFKMIAKGISPVVGQKKYLSLIYVKNLVQALLLAARSETALGQTYFFSDGPPKTWEELTDLIARALDKHPLKISIPEWLLVVPAEISGIIGKITHRAMLLNREKIIEMKQHYWTVDISRAEKELAYRPLWSTEQGIQETARWYQQEGWL